jgi:hypothetical protein
VPDESDKQSLFRVWGNSVGKAVENEFIPFIFNARESLGQPIHPFTDLPRTSLNILAREDVLVLQWFARK